MRSPESAGVRSKRLGALASLAGDDELEHSATLPSPQTVEPTSFGIRPGDFLLAVARRMGYRFLDELSDDELDAVIERRRRLLIDAQLERGRRFRLELDRGRKAAGR